MEFHNGVTWNKILKKWIYKAILQCKLCFFSETFSLLFVLSVSEENVLSPGMSGQKYHFTIKLLGESREKKSAKLPSFP